MQFQTTVKLIIFSQLYVLYMKRPRKIKPLFLSYLSLHVLTTNFLLSSLSNLFKICLFYALCFYLCFIFSLLIYFFFIVCAEKYVIFNIILTLVPANKFSRLILLFLNYIKWFFMCVSLFYSISWYDFCCFWLQYFFCFSSSFFQKYFIYIPKIYVETLLL